MAMRVPLNEKAVRLGAQWLRLRAEACLREAQECDRIAETWWAGFTLWRFRWRRQAAWWRVEQEDWNALADEMEERGQP